MQDVKAAIDELERAVTVLGLKGAELDTVVNGENWDAPTLPAAVQGGGGDGGGAVLPPAAAAQLHGRSARGATGVPNSLGVIVEDAIVVAALIVGGVLEACPDLKACIAHGGGPACFAMGRLDRGWRGPARRRAGAHPVSRRAAYQRRLYYDSVVGSEAALRFLLDRVGADRVVLGSDWPFVPWHPSPVTWVRGARRRMTAATRRSRSCTGGTWRRCCGSSRWPPRRGDRMPKRYDYVTVDVFTTTRFGGKPLAVVPDARRNLSANQMQSIAREFNYSESTFILPPSIFPTHTARVRIFTPTQEIPFAGHPNVGTAFVLARLAERTGAPLGATVRFEEAAGLVPVDLERDAAGHVVGATLTAPQPLALDQTIPAAVIAECVGLGGRGRAHVVGARAVAVASVGLPFVLAEVAPDAIGRAVSDAAATASAARRYAFRSGRFSVHIYARRTPGRRTAPISGRGCSRRWAAPARIPPPAAPTER